MHPTPSIIFFTTASGAGFGLLLLLGIGVPLGLLPHALGFGFAALGLAAVFAVGGLVASAFHLGRPERAWRAFSQWRSSWLSREGVAAVLTFVPAAVFAAGWLLFGDTSGFVGLCGVVAAALAFVTICCTGMIYASLRPIRQWHNSLVVPNYLALAAMSGLLLLDLVVRLGVSDPVGVPLLAIAAIFVAWWLKERYWRSIDTGSAASTIASATALGRAGRVRLLEPPNTEENFLLKEMGFRIARKHRTRLRAITRAASFMLPLAATLAALFWSGPAGALAAAVAVVCAALGLVVERWLFFAEATHTVMLYYGAETA